MSRGFAPAFGFASGLHGVADVLAGAQGRLSTQTSVRAAHFDAVTRVGSPLLAADIELHSAVDRRSGKILRLLWRLVDCERVLWNRRRVLHPGGLEIL